MSHFPNVDSRYYNVGETPSRPGARHSKHSLLIRRPRQSRYVRFFVPRTRSQPRHYIICFGFAGGYTPRLQCLFWVGADDGERCGAGKHCLSLRVIPGITGRTRLLPGGSCRAKARLRESAGYKLRRRAAPVGSFRLFASQKSTSLSDGGSRSIKVIIGNYALLYCLFLIVFVGEAPFSRLDWRRFLFAGGETPPLLLTSSLLLLTSHTPPLQALF